jgi:tetratricopeptide (TPR) repeat protein
MTADRRRPLPLLAPGAAASEYHRRGVAHVAAGRHAEAVAAFSLCLDHDPTPAASWFHRGCAYLNASDHARALADFDEAIRRDAGPARFHFYRGAARHALGDFAGAVADYTAVLERYPDDRPARLARGRAHARLERWATAVADFDEVLRHDPGHAAALADRCRALGQLGRHAAARADARRAVELRPNDVMILNQLAWLLATCPDDGARNGSEAVTVATRAAELSQWRDAAVLDTLAAAYAECGEFGEAVRWAEAALVRAPAEEVEAIAERLATFRRICSDGARG